MTRSAVRTLILRYKDRIPALARFEAEMDKFRYAADLMSNLVGLIAGIGESLYVIIDEYDTFANDMLSAGHKSLYSAATDQSGLVRAFYRTLKAGSGSGAIARVFITGATPILLDDLMTGFNIVTNISLEPRFNALAGFTKADVARAADRSCHGTSGSPTSPVSFRQTIGRGVDEQPGAERRYAPVQRMHGRRVASDVARQRVNAMARSR